MMPDERARGRGRAGREARRGFAILIILGVVLVVLFVAFFVHTMSRAQVRLTAGFVDHQIAFHMAEAGVEQALFALKSDLISNQALLTAVAGEIPVDIDFGTNVTDSLRLLVEPPAFGDVLLWARYEPEVPENPTIGDYRVGRLTVRSQGVYTTPQGRVARKQLRVVTKVTGINLGIVAPEHGLFVRDPLPVDFKVPDLDLDVRDLAVMGGHVYIENGLRAELTEHLMNEEFRPMRQVGFFDLGVDTYTFSSLFNGGINLTHSKLLEYKTNGIIRKYYKFQGLRSIFAGRGAYRLVEEPYVPEVRPRPQGYTDREINLFRPRDYREVADLVIDPTTPQDREGDPGDNKYFMDVYFRGPLGSRNTIFRNVLPLYGYGDWRRVPARFGENPTRRHDISNAITLDGVTFVKGDVYLEGWYQGLGTLVVQGNVYAGGDFISLPPQVTGYQSLANLVVLEDPDREPYGPGERFNKATGRIIYKPHHDMDWDRTGLNLVRDLTPVLDTAIYAQNGMDVDRTSIFDQLVNMEIEFNFAAELFDFERLPHDLTVFGSDPVDVLRGVTGRRGNDLFYNPQFSSELISWEEETPADV